MNKRYLINFCIFLFILFFLPKNHAQTFKLEIILDKKNQQLEAAYIKIHQDTLSVKKEILKFSNKLIENGYFFNQLDSVVTDNFITKAYFSLKSKIATIKIIVKDLKIKKEVSSKITDDYMVIPTDSVAKTLHHITEQFQNKGKPFSKVYLQDFILKDSLLEANLIVEEENIRKIDKIEIKGYENFPVKYLSNLINTKKAYNQDYILEINNQINQLDFVKTTKNPEVLFTNDSTYIYMYLEKTQNSAIDANINFTSSTENEFIFNGKVDLELINIFNKGNRYKLYWNSVSNRNQSFELSTEVPYIFSSKLTPNLKFSIFKQDSTFVNTNFNFELQYVLNNKLSIAVLFENESSNNLISNSNTASFTKNFTGFGAYSFKRENHSIFTTKYAANFKILFGNRNSTNLNTTQIKINTNVSYLWEVNSRNFIFNNLNFGYLKSDNFLENELFRIGGANSIRGFAEQSIYSKSYLVSNLEYRFLTSSTSYLYSITDLGWTTSISNNNLLISGVGFGYLFTSKNSTIDLAIAVNKTSKTSFDFKNSQLIIGWKNYF